MLDVDLKVVLEVLTDAGQIDHGVDAQGVQVGSVSNAGELEELWCVDGAACEDHFACVHVMGPAVTAVSDAGCHVAREVDLGDQGPGQDGQVVAAEVRPEVRAGRREPLALVDIAVKCREAFLAVTVDVIGQRVPGFLSGAEEGLEQGVRGRTAFKHEGPGVPAQFIVRVRGGGVFHPVEVRQAMREVPRFHPGVCSPAFVVQGVTALENHAVDGAGAAQYLAACVRDTPAAHVRLGVRLVAPVVEADSRWER